MDHYVTKTNCDKQNFPNQFHLHLTLNFKSCSFHGRLTVVEVVQLSCVLMSACVFLSYQPVEVLS